MSYGSGARFEADVGKLRGFVEKIRALGKQIRAMAAEFESDLQKTSMWYGIDDDFHNETAPGDKRDVKSMVESLYAVADAFDSITESSFQLQNILNTQANAMDTINELNAMVQGIGGPSGGKR